MKNELNPVFPSILSTDFFNLEGRLKKFAGGHIDYIHLDVMDGHFVSNLSFGPSAAKAIKNHFPFKIDAHLMVDPPARMIPWFIEAGSDWISFHLEAEGDTDNNIAVIKDAGRGAGLVLNPDTPVENVFPYLEAVDFVLLMSVFPGYGGQEFIVETVDRVARLKQETARLGTDCLIQVDGGVNVSNVRDLKTAGADLFVVGTFLFNADNVEKTIENLLFQINKSGD
jgi:ribulose-phosphate 3-epimerase